MGVNMDWKKESTRGEVYPEGTYKVRIDSFERVTASTGTPQIRWRVKIVDPVQFEGKSMIDHTALTEKALWKLAWLVSAAGINVEKLGKMDVDSPAFHRILKVCETRTMYWHVIDGLTPNGKSRNEVDDFQRDESQEPVDVITEEEVPDFLRRSNGEI